MQYHAALFDLDGTLLDSLRDIADATNRTLAAHGFPTHPQDAYRQFIGDGMTKLIARALPADRREGPTLPTCVEYYRGDYGAHWNVHSRLYDGIPAMLDGLVARQIRLAILSNKPDEFVQQCVRQYLGDWRFDVIMGAGAGYPHKPDPAAALAIAGEMGTRPDRSVYLGDMEVDIATARAAGMLAVGAAWGFRTPAQLTAAGAQFALTDPLQLLEIVDAPGR